jgi:hypothetical protein
MLRQSCNKGCKHKNTEIWLIYKEKRSIPSADPSSLSLPSSNISSPLDIPDIYSSSESIPIVRGVGGSAFAAAEATPLFSFFEGLEETIASAAFLFFGWEEIVSTVGATRLSR